MSIKLMFALLENRYVEIYLLALDGSVFSV